MFQWLVTSITVDPLPSSSSLTTWQHLLAELLADRAPQRRFEIQRRQAMPSEGSSMGETLYCEFNGSRAVRKQRVQAIDYLDKELLSAP